MKVNFVNIFLHSEQCSDGALGTIKFSYKNLQCREPKPTVVKLKLPAPNFAVWNLYLRKYFTTFRSINTCVINEILHCTKKAHVVHPNNRFSFVVLRNSYFRQLLWLKDVQETAFTEKNAYLPRCQL